MNGAGTDPRQLLAFYLPQFHVTPENDVWWGPGFSEWRNVVKARPLFPGHEQPRLPGELGYYDLRVPETRAMQAALARVHGIDGFCYYHYWFGGRRMLERPLTDVRSTDSPDFPFCLLWANENWTRTWDAGLREMLIEQVYSPEDDEDHGRYLIEQFGDDRYIRVGGRPLLGVYRVQTLPDPQRTFDRWRAMATDAGVGEPYIVKFETWGDFSDPAPYGCDASAEFPPHAVFEHLAPIVPEGSDPANEVADYRAVSSFFADRPHPGWDRYPTVVPSWDNTPRRPQGPAKMLLGRDPDWFRSWLEAAIRRVDRTTYPIVFVNAWNEWAEGAYLEPDEAYGRAFLEAVASARASAGWPASSIAPGRSGPRPADPTFEELYVELYERDLRLQHDHVELQAMLQRRIEAVVRDDRLRIAELEAQLARWRRP